MINELQLRNWMKAAIAYGGAVHLKLYPIAYAPAIVIYIATSSSNTLSPTSALLSNLSRITKFALLAAGTFMILSLLCYCLYGQQFIEECFLYHLTRLDTRHNFSLHFYSILLGSAAQITPFGRMLMILVTFVPQMLLIVYLSFKLTPKSLPLALFAISNVFVHFNKVLTAQYFLWYICLLPLIVPLLTHMSNKKCAVLMAMWFGTELHWLYWAYFLEMQTENTFTQIFIASIMFFVTNCYIVGEIVKTAMKADINAQNIYSSRFKRCKLVKHS